ncbi:Cap15 family cyclic dinucleotide receptor domain-containing protein [Sinorhizobium medicae]|uniref:Cap15 family cyclic dinucleotide receptor domain-containing protein n=1 Tax=Sinorhizobium medicae TaxID=110321 RepID=UPI0013E39595
MSGPRLCEAETLNSNGSVKNMWSRQITVLQSWDRLRVHLKTANSESDSINAALTCDPARGYILLYHYKNQPRIGEPDLRSQRGCAELKFNPDPSSASGEYSTATDGHIHSSRPDQPRWIQKANRDPSCLESRNKDRFRPSGLPPRAGDWCSRSKRRPYVTLTRLTDRAVSRNRA